LEIVGTWSPIGPEDCGGANTGFPVMGCDATIFRLKIQ
jgi:hypothetical protein